MTASELMERLNAAVSEYGDMPVVHEGDGLLSEPRLHLDMDMLGSRTLVITRNMQFYEQCHEDED